MTFDDIIGLFRSEALTERIKGNYFELLMQRWLRADPRYSHLFAHVWLWSEFGPATDLGGRDTGIDLVAMDDQDNLWAIQCKCYKEETQITEAAVGTFTAMAGAAFTIERPDALGLSPKLTADIHTFAHRLWLSTTNNWSNTADHIRRIQQPPVNIFSTDEFRASRVDWAQLLRAVAPGLLPDEERELLAKAEAEAKPEAKSKADGALEPRELRKYQKEAVESAIKYFATNDRGKLIMACGTGKTFTALRLTEQLVPEGGMTLFLVPSIALLGQALNDWCADRELPFSAVAVCSDSRTNRNTRRRQSDDDTVDESPADLCLPASTSPDAVAAQLRFYRSKGRRIVVFSTYQSVDVVTEALKLLGEADLRFDLMIADEAHRTTGVATTDRRAEMLFMRPTAADFPALKRLYMTATPRIYGDAAKARAGRADNLELCSMDDEKLYGREIYRMDFGRAVKEGFLTDYRVLVLAVGAAEIPTELKEWIENPEQKNIDYNTAARIIGAVIGLSKRIEGDGGAIRNFDPGMMRRAMIFTDRIGRKENPAPGSSLNLTAIFEKVTDLYKNRLDPDKRALYINPKIEHVDGSVPAPERARALAWLREENTEPGECRIVSNVRCLAEGVDVPALDAVVFMSPRSSQIDIVQSVGRVMRRAEGKRMGYIILPIVVPEGLTPEAAIRQEEAFGPVWQLLNAIRSHDARLDIEINSLAVNRDISFPRGSDTSGTGHIVFGHGLTDDCRDEIERRYGFQSLNLDYFYARLVEKCGTRIYWESWGGRVGQIARTYIARISALIEREGDYRREFDRFAGTLRRNLNPGLSDEQCITMLAQHLVTAPVFQRLFADYRFLSNNSITRSMQTMVERLRSSATDRENDELKEFYRTVDEQVERVETLDGKQRVIKTLYESFFKQAFPLTVEQLGTVYTPVECVDFMLRSVDAVLRQEFHSSLTAEGVHVLDPFVGTGTFVTRLFQTGVIRPEDMRRKYQREVHCNEIELLAYYIADVNIEAVFQAACPQAEYLPYDNICLTDTFQSSEPVEQTLFSPRYFAENAALIADERETPVRVIVGNPPYSIGQKSANDNAQNRSYPHLEQRIRETYAAGSTATLNKGLYDSYIKAFRWATDRIDRREGGVVAFISNSGWLDAQAMEGFRASLVREHDIIYLYNLRGNQRTQGELSRREGGKVFGSGSRTPIAITILVRYGDADPRRGQGCRINYYEVEDYQSRDQKLALLKQFGSIERVPWTQITPNRKNDWINQRGDEFYTLLPLAPEKNFDNTSLSFFTVKGPGVASGRDAWVYGFSRPAVEQNMQRMVEAYERQFETGELNLDPTEISQTRGLRGSFAKGVHFEYRPDALVEATYRPFCRMVLYRYRPFIESYGIFDRLFPAGQSNLVICVSGKGTKKDFTCMITDCIPDYNSMEAGCQCFPLYYYREQTEIEQSLLEPGTGFERYTRHSAISPRMLRMVRERYHGADITPEELFYYVYGLLHSPDYRTRFSAELKKELPRLPLPDDVSRFMAFVQAGRRLADLHLHYDTQPAPDGMQREWTENRDQESGVRDQRAYAVADRLRFAARDRRDVIVVNSRLRLAGIPASAYDYRVNGRSPIEWVMERYRVTVDKESHIPTDPDAWGREHGRPDYIPALVESVATVALRTEEIVASLPPIE